MEKLLQSYNSFFVQFITPINLILIELIIAIKVELFSFKFVTQELQSFILMSQQHAFLWQAKGIKNVPFYTGFKSST